MFLSQRRKSNNAFICVALQQSRYRNDLRLTSVTFFLLASASKPNMSVAPFQSAIRNFTVSNHDVVSSHDCKNRCQAVLLALLVRNIILCVKSLVHRTLKIRIFNLPSFAIFFQFHLTLSLISIAVKVKYKLHLRLENKIKCLEFFILT